MALRRVRLVIAIALLAALTAVSGTGCSTVSGPVPAQAGDRLRIVLERNEPLAVSFIGDSLSQGLFASSQVYGFHGLMVEHWRQFGPVIDSAARGITGGTTADALQAQEFPREQQIVVVELGTNDFARVPYQEFRRSYALLLDSIKRSSPATALVCAGPWRPRNESARFDVIIKDACEARGGRFRSLSDLAEIQEFIGPPGRQTEFGRSDDFHPNDAGHRAIADRLLPAVEVTRS